MNIIISNSSNLPIYEQITQQIKTQILKGELKEGDALPSMRALAKDLKVSVITTKRAYNDLEQEGFIETIVGKGSYVASKNLELVREEKLKLIEEKFEEIIEIATISKISLKELKEILEILYKGD
ncbi:GntR family transcriptional regulator [Miniphocaeibacter halophilus]|uniref:GntR family transcriptional regulator n=1 Tax=Miniphocaeibacter halophilus TaxID=2931922 RepID=A0AC61MT29_9FIRM|nr:GntR family transcriptional regulator [Miniphocaeibacter halophilus]QQK08503.1 GntR family transcriptional regulator [Miniphocaeibacter halophilus]